MKFSFDEVALGTIANFSYGYTETALNQGDIRFIRITDIDERGNLKEANARYINISDGIDKYTVKKGDLLVARTGGTFGKTLYYNSDILSVYASFLIFISRNRINIGFRQKTLLQEENNLSLMLMYLKKLLSLSLHFPSKKPLPPCFPLGIRPSRKPNG